MSTLNPTLSYEMLKKIIDSAHDEIYITDANGMVIYANKAVETHSGIAIDDIIGKSSQEISQKQYWSPRISPLVLKEKKAVTLEQKTQNGTCLLTTAIPLFDKTGRLEYIIENSRDITETTGLKNELLKSSTLLDRYATELTKRRQEEIDVPQFVSGSPKMNDLLLLVDRISQADSTILILGESGSGKSHMAKRIHKSSRRNNGPFIAVNCASIPAELMEAELFGYSKGAFTGANAKGNIGLIELASEGTLFLDEIAELPLKMQSKLLQVLQEGHYYKVGGRDLQKVNCRFIAATNRDIHEMIRTRRFREDLYYRLNVFELELPPLRERRQEIIPLAMFFLKKFNRKYNCHHRFSNNVLEIFTKYDWPGNARELENMVERLIIVNKKPLIEAVDLPRGFDNLPVINNIEPVPEAPVTAAIPANMQLLSQGSLSLDELLDNIIQSLIKDTYQRTGSSYEVAKALQISQSKASRLIRKYLSNQ